MSQIPTWGTASTSADNTVSRGPVSVLAAELAAKIERGHGLAPSSWKMVVLRIQPRIHPLARTTYAEVDAYLYADSRVVELGRYRTDESELDEMLRSIMRDGEAR